MSPHASERRVVLLILLVINIVQGDCRGFGRSSTMTRLSISYIRVLLSNSNEFLSEPANLNTPLVDATECDFKFNAVT